MCIFTNRPSGIERCRRRNPPFVAVGYGVAVRRRGGTVRRSVCRGTRSRVGEVVAKPHGRRSDENESREGDTAPQAERPVRIEGRARETDALERNPESRRAATANAAQRGQTRGPWAVREAFNRPNADPT